MLKAILFDAYGTLISTGNGSVKAVEKILKLNKRADISAVDFYGDWKKYHREHINSLVGFVNEEAIFHICLKKLYEKYGLCRNADEDIKIMLDTLDKRVLFEETKEVIDALREKYTVCIASTTDTAPLMENLKHNDLAVDRVFTSESLRVYKPNPLFYTRILNELGLDAFEVLFVGDSVVDDVLGPKSVGIKSCLINRKNTAFSGKIYPDFEISNLKELCGIAEICSY